MRPESAPPELREQFELGSPLGTGSRGVVWPALERTTGRQCAVKALHRASPVDSAYLKGEYRALVRCAHPHVVATHRLVVRPGTCWFEMDLIAGPPVTRWARGLDGPWSPEVDARFRRVTSQLVAAVQAIHTLGLVHRDIKPDNILVGPNDHLVLLDFDLAGPPTADPSLGRILGTPGYRPPEQALGLPVGPAADWFAVGAVMYEMVTGQPPFGRRPRAALRAQRRRRIPDPHNARADLPADLCAIIRDLVQPEPSRRPSPAALARTFPFSGGPPLPSLSRGTQDRCRTALADPRPSWTDLCGGTASQRRSLIRSSLPTTCPTLSVRIDPAEDVPDRLRDATAGSTVRLLRGWSREDRVSVLPRDRIALLDAFPDFALLPELASFSPREPSQRGAPLARLLEAITDRQPLCLVIEDAHQLTDHDVASLGRLLGARPQLSIVTEADTPSSSAALRGLHPRFALYQRVRIGPS